MYGNDNFATGYALGRDSGTGGNGNNANNGWGDAWWIVVLLIFGWGGFGNGFGNRNNGGSSSSGAADGYILTTDFANIERKLDGVNNGLCDGFYSVNTSFGNLNNTLAQNTAQLQNSMNQGFNGINNAIVSQGYESRIATQGLGSQLSDCCCTIQSILANINCNISEQANSVARQVEQGFCQSNYNNQNNTRDIIQSTHNDTDRIIARLDAMESARKDEKILSLQTENQSLRNQAFMAANNNYLIDSLRPVAKPAYITCNPYSNASVPVQISNIGGYGGCNTGCSGCGSGVAVGTATF